MKQVHVILAATLMSATMLTTATAQQAVDEVIVTARKVGESIQDVPVAVSAFTEETIRELGIQSVDDVARFTPGFSYSQAFGRSTERPVLRGAATILAGTGIGVENGASYFLDGMYYPGDISSLDMNMIERVEVVRGPQSAIFGRNTYSGAVNFITREIGDEVVTMTNAEFAQHDTYRLYGGVSGALTENLKASFSVSHYEYGGEFVNAADNNSIAGSEESQTVAMSFDWQASDNLRIRTNMLWAEHDDGTRALSTQKAEENNCMPGYRSNAFRDPITSNGPGGNDNAFQYYCGVLQPTRIVTESVSPTFGSGVKRDVMNINLRADYDMTASHTLSFKGHIREDERGTGTDFAHLAEHTLFSESLNVYEDMSAEISVISDPAERLNYQFGLFYYDYEDTVDSGFFGGALAYADTDTVTNQAVFGMVEYDITDTLIGSVEGRYAEDEKTYYAVATRTDPIVSQDGTFDSFTHRSVLTWKATEDISFYGSYAEGTKPGGFNGYDGITNDKPDFEEEEVEAFEIGMKSTWLDDRVTANVSAYQNDITNYQLTTPVVTANAVNSIVTNQGDVEVTGFEVELTTFPSDNVKFGLNYAWTDAEFVRGCDEFQFTLTSGGYTMGDTPNSYLNFYEEGDTDVDGNAVTAQNAGYRSEASPNFVPGTDAEGNDYTDYYNDEELRGDCSIVGHKAPLVSEHQFSLYVQANFPMQNGMEFFINADTSYESSKFTQVHNLAESGDAVLVGASVGLKSENWTIDLFGRNLTDEDSVIVGTRWLNYGYARTSDLSGLGTSASTLDNQRPRGFIRSLRKGRQIGVRLRYQF